ncbi:DUF6939 family protein [Mycolicibacterium mageritense]|uniref:DUF6939 family protein n=1 Tax=Mycolicibacterium mageritense TaxID=53462 RepID=UPI003898F5CE
MITTREPRQIRSPPLPGTLSRTLGHRCGLNDSGELLSYVEARRKIYLPSYRWVLDHCIGRLVDKLRAEAKRHPVVLLDYTTNGNVEDTHRPLSHAALVVRYLENDWPGER